MFAARIASICAFTYPIIHEPPSSHEETASELTPWDVIHDVPPRPPAISQRRSHSQRGAHSRIKSILRRPRTVNSPIRLKRRRAIDATGVRQLRSAGSSQRRPQTPLSAFARMPYAFIDSFSHLRAPPSPAPNSMRACFHRIKLEAKFAISLPIKAFSP